MKRSWLETVLSPWREILQNKACLCVVLYEILAALEPALPEEEIQKHVHSTQYQFQVFKNVDCFMSLRRRYLDKAVTLLFYDSIMQRYKRKKVCSTVEWTWWHHQNTNNKGLSPSKFSSKLSPESCVGIYKISRLDVEPAVL